MDNSHAPKFTAGPWIPGHHTDPNHSCECRSILCSDYMGRIAYIAKDDGESDSPPEEQAIANAFLIAAAPEMFGALSIIGERLRILEPALDGTPRAEAAAIIRIIHSAIARATGGTDEQD